MNHKYRMASRRWSTVAVCLVAFLVCSVDAYSKFGRTCKDIGCLSQETCVMALESCSYSQRDGKDCGSYPTCKRNPNGGGSDAGIISDLDDLVPQHKPPPPPRREHAEPGPAYPNHSPSGGNLYPDLSPSGGGGGYVNPGGYTPPGYQPPAAGGSDYYGGGGGHHQPTKPASSGGGSSIGSFFSSLGGGGGGSGSSALNGILSSLGGNSNQGSSSGSGLTNILGSLGGSLLSGGANGDTNSGGGSTLTGLLNQFTGGNNRGSNSGGSNGGGANGQSQGGAGSGFLSSLGGALAGSLIQNALNPKNNNGDGGGVNTRRFGGLFSENPSGGSSSDGGRYASGSASTGSAYKGYPTQPAYRSDTAAADRRSASTMYNSGQSYGSSRTESPVQYGWNV